MSEIRSSPCVPNLLPIPPQPVEDYGKSFIGRYVQLPQNIRNDRKWQEMTGNRKEFLISSVMYWKYPLWGKLTGTAGDDVSLVKYPFL